MTARLMSELRWKERNCPTKNGVCGRRFRLSMPTLEMLELIAYKQPVTGASSRYTLSFKGSSLLEAFKSVLLMLSALFPIVNPLGGSPVFLSLTREYSRSARKMLAWRVAVNSFVLLIASTFVGTHILNFFGISIPVVQVGGGLIVISNGWAMLKRSEDSEREHVARKNVKRDIFSNAFYPLTLPLTVGPGSISVAITLGANIPHHLGSNIWAIVSTVIASALIALSIYLCYGFADRLAAIVGESGMSIIMRLSSFLLVCIGVQIFWNGASALLRTLPASGH